MIPLQEEQVLVIPRRAVRNVGQLELVDVLENGQSAGGRSAQDGRLAMMSRCSPDSARAKKSSCPLRRSQLGRPLMTEQSGFAVGTVDKKADSPIVADMQVTVAQKSGQSPACRNITSRTRS